MPLFGISVALLTPFQGDGRVNLPLLCDHATGVMLNGARGVTLFGTTGEGASIGFDERRTALRAMIRAGVSPDVLTVGICASALSDAAAQIAQAREFDVTRFLLLPPFYFNDLDDEGLFEWHERLFETVDPAAQFILYHIPQLSQVPLSVDLILRLKTAHPNRVLAVKDSAGQWENTRALLDTRAIAVLVGDERLLHRAMPLGAAGSICGMANLHPDRLRTIFDTHAEDTELSKAVDLIVSGPVIPALKRAMVAATGNVDWGHLRAPLRPVSAQIGAALDGRFAHKAPAQ